jgi:hypothetical protein
MATAPPAHPFNVHSYNVLTDTKGDLFGGAPDLPTAIVICCAIFVATQNYSLRDSIAFAVYDQTATAVAFVGHYVP